jgi:hypothetical protein
MATNLLCNGIEDLGVQEQSIHIKYDMGYLLVGHGC